jgi:ADP-heptose:LPS heptosyltransferase
MKKIFNINGGIGRCIAFTGVAKRLKEKEPDTEIEIISNHPDVFFNNPNVDRVYPINMPYLWDNIKNEHYYEPEPYNMYEYYHDKKHMINCFNIIVNGEDILTMPELYLTEAELNTAKMFIEKQGKPIILFQPHGQGGGLQGEDTSYRSLDDEYSTKLAKELSKKGEVFIIKLPEQRGIKGYQTFNGLNGRQIAALIPYVKYCVGIDSFLQHAATSMKVPMSVFWGATLQEQTGYEMHHNLEPTKKPIYIPNRIPHNMMNIERHNQGSMKFSDKQIDEILEKIK